ncbi:hypothetical protein DFJ74DRAFT_647659 [Hyaloraphidium curvatum]|nr:hypothetical protein DFJ74DRAFT_647659 [Hyaloraphidium curvatum]
MLLALLVLALAGSAAAQCATTHPFVGFRGRLATIEPADNMGGVIEIIDDCTFRWSEATIVAGVPAVFWWGASSADDATLRRSGRVNDQQVSTAGLNGQSFTYRLSRGRTWYDGINVLSGWCEAFSANLAMISLQRSSSPPPAPPPPAPAPVPAPSPPGGNCARGPAPYPRLEVDPRPYQTCRAPVDGPSYPGSNWVCLQDQSGIDSWVPVKRTQYGQVGCMSTNSWDCIWTPRSCCEALAVSGNDRSPYFECGTLHQRVWGTSGYTDSWVQPRRADDLWLTSANRNHWCSRGWNLLNPGQGVPQLGC